MSVARTLHERFTRRETLKPRIDHSCAEYGRPGPGGNTLIRTSGTGCSALHFSRRPQSIPRSRRPQPSPQPARSEATGDVRGRFPCPMT